MNPPDMTEAGVAAWLRRIYDATAGYGRISTYHCDPVVAAQAHAVLALVEAKVLVALSEVDRIRESLDDDETNAIVSRVMKGPA